ncbi:MAG: RdgB/HAM1 family non-canonical purine NTP pyrophosphatase [Pseudomonadota bacterium]|nr:RdgB/HAM1 family non-canonical purine NTP pyrophosphatase [Pseudomonadota bacterium]
MKLWLATTNNSKIREIKSLLEHLKIEIHTCGELSYYSAPNEIGKTFEENARIKAKSLHSVVPQDWVLAEDSGLEVECLGNLPGVHSARYAGPKASDAENTSKLIKMISLKLAENRKARFACCMILLSPTSKESVFMGHLSGEITKALRGTQGFGYDQVFQPLGETKTMAEMDLAQKNRISHRAKAISELKEFFKNFIEQST